ncbi:MAG: hypothetical protein ACR2NZ_03935 [Rubripirellula sp.]
MMTPFHLYLYGPSRGPIATSFEEVEQRLTKIDQLYFEPDGSFVWSGKGGQEQVFGMVYDAGGQVQYCELRGRCQRKHWRLLYQAIAGTATEGLEVLLLPIQQLQDLQTFEESLD